MDTNETIAPVIPEVKDADLAKAVQTAVEKSLDVVDMKTAKEKVSDIVAVKDPGRWVLVCKASSKEQGWMKSTKAFQIVKPHGALIQVTTQQKNPDGSYSLAEALVHVPDLDIRTIIPPE